MKKHLVSILTLVFCMSMMLAGCGANEAEPEEPITDSGNGEYEYFLNLNEPVTVDGVGEFTLTVCEVLDDKAMADGWVYYYAKDLDEHTTSYDWKPSEGNYTSVRMVVDIKNTTDKPQTYADRMIAQLFYQVNNEAETDNYEGTCMQRNPGQVDQYDSEVASTACAEIAPGETTKVDIIIDVTEDMYKGMYETAQGESTGIFEKVEFNFGDGTTYIIDLVHNMTCASDAE